MFTARPRHPITGRRIRLRARTARELASYQHRIDSLRTGLRLGLISPEEVSKQLSRLVHGPVTFERACVDYASRPSLARTTREAVRSLVRTHFRSLLVVELAALDAERLSQWIESLQRAGLQATTIGTVWRKLRAVVRYALGRGLITSSPWGTWNPRLGGRSRRLARECARSVGELVSLFDAARRLDGVTYAGLEAKIMCKALLGLRQGELGGLRWSDLDTAERTVTIARQWHDDPIKGKQNVVRMRTIVELVDALARHRDELVREDLFAEDGPIFPSPVHSSPGDARAYLRGPVLSSVDLRSAVRLAGLPNVDSWTPHSLRDSFVTLEADACGGDLARVQPRSRHASLASLARYLRERSRQLPVPPAISSLPRAETGGTGNSPEPVFLPHKT